MTNIFIRKAANGWILTQQHPGEMNSCRPDSERVFITAQALADGVKKIVEPGETSSKDVGCKLKNFTTREPDPGRFKLTGPNATCFSFEMEPSGRVKTWVAEDMPHMMFVSWAAFIDRCRADMGLMLDGVYFSQISR